MFTRIHKYLTKSSLKLYTNEFECFYKLTIETSLFGFLFIATARDSRPTRKTNKVFMLNLSVKDRGLNLFIELCVVTQNIVNLLNKSLLSP